MLINKKTINKFLQIEDRYSNLRYEIIAKVPMEMCETYEHFTCEPGDGAHVEWREVPAGTKWGDNWLTAWFRGSLMLPEPCIEKKYL